MTINSRVFDTVEQIYKIAHPKSIFITDTHVKIGAVNDFNRERAVKSGVQVVRVVADHVPALMRNPYPDKTIRNTLYNHKGDIKGAATTLMLSHIDLYVGSREGCELGCDVGCLDG